MTSDRTKSRTWIVLSVLVWLALPYVLMGVTGNLFGGGEWAIWLTIGLVGFAAVRVRRRKLRRG